MTDLLGIFCEIAFLSGVYWPRYVDISSGTTTSTIHLMNFLNMTHVNKGGSRAYSQAAYLFLQ